MILSNVEIQRAINERRLIISPEPQSCDYDTTAVNLHLGTGLAIPKEGSFNYDLTKPGFAATPVSGTIHALWNHIRFNKNAEYKAGRQPTTGLIDYELAKSNAEVWLKQEGDLPK